MCVCVLLCCGGACVWCVVKLGTHLSLSPSSSFCFSFSLAPSLTLALALSLSLLSSLLLTLLFSTNTVQSDVAHGTFIATPNELHGMFPPLLLPPLLSSLLPLSHTQKKERELFITGIFPAMNLFFTTVLNKFQKLATGENYSHYSFILIPKQ